MVKITNDFTIIDNTITQYIPSEEEEEEQANHIEDAIEEAETIIPKKHQFNPLSGILGLATYPFKLILLLPGLLGQAIMSLIVSGYGTDGSQGWLTIDNILFNQLALTDINIFSNSVYLIDGANAGIKVSRVPDALKPMRDNIAMWYYALRNLAIVLSLLMLIYLGIKIAITNIASKKAEYKNMLINWATGFGLIFILHYIIVLVININNGIIQILARANLDPNNEKYKNIMNQLFSQSWWIDFTTSWTSAILYVILVIITFIVLIMFIKRVLTVSILIAFAPLISVTYSIDKSGDNKSQIVDAWLKEFMYNVFIQIAYALSYLVFGKIAIDIIDTSAIDFGATFLAILSMLSMFLGVKIIKQIFGFDKASSLVQQMAMAGVTAKVISTAAKGVKGAKGFVDDRIKKREEAQTQDALKDVPNYSASGKSKKEIAQEIMKEKKAKEMRDRIAEKSKKREEKPKTRRPLKNQPKIIATPLRMYRTAFIKAADKVLKINDIGYIADKVINKAKNAMSGKEEIKVDAQEIFERMFKDYADVEDERLGTKMTAEQFDENIRRVRGTPYENLNKADRSLSKTLSGLDTKYGKQQAQAIISHFKDGRWGTNV